MIKKYHVSKQLFDKSATMSATSYYLDENGGLQSNIGFDVTDYYDVTSNTDYYLNDMNISSMYPSVCFYDSNKTFISGIKYNQKTYLAFTTPSNAKYIKFSVNKNKKDTAMLSLGSTALPYEPYGNTWNTIGYKKYGTETDTFSTLPHEVIGDGTAISAYTIKGNMSQSGTPTPSNPVYPQEVGEETANLSPNNTFTNTTTDTRSYLSLALQAYSDSGFLNQNLTNVTENKKAIVTLTAASGTTRLTVVHNGATQNIRIVPYFSAEAGKYTLVADVTGYNPTVAGGIVLSNIMILSGEYTLETIPPYEPTGYKIPISFGQGTYTSYHSQPIRKIGNVVDTSVSSGTDTYNIRKLVLTGQESWNISLGVFYLGTITDDYLRSSGNITYLSSHYNAYQQQSSAGSVPDKYFGFGDNSSVQRLYVHDSTYSTVQDFQAYLAAQYANGTPVTIWYVLATPTTETFTAPSIPTSGSPQSFDVDTTLKPSEVSLTYHGWHEHSDTKFTTP